MTRQRWLGSLPRRAFLEARAPAPERLGHTTTPEQGNGGGAHNNLPRGGWQEPGGHSTWWTRSPSPGMGVRCSTTMWRALPWCPSRWPQQCMSPRPQTLTSGASCALRRLCTCGYVPVPWRLQPTERSETVQPLSLETIGVYTQSEDTTHPLLRLLMSCAGPSGRQHGGSSLQKAGQRGHGRAA